MEESSGCNSWDSDNFKISCVLEKRGDGLRTSVSRTNEKISGTTICHSESKLLHPRVSVDVRQKWNFYRPAVRCCSIFDPDRIVSSLTTRRWTEKNAVIVLSSNTFLENSESTFASVVHVLRLSTTFLDNAPSLGCLSLLLLFQFFRGFLSQQQLRAHRRKYLSGHGSIKRMEFRLEKTSKILQIKIDRRVVINYRTKALKMLSKENYVKSAISSNGLETSEEKNFSIK